MMKRYVAKRDVLARAANKLKRELHRLPAVRAVLGYEYLQALEDHALRLPPLDAGLLPFFHALRKDGAYVTPVESLRLPGTREMLAACDTLAAELRALPLNGENAPRLPVQRLMQLPEIYLWGLDSRLLDFIENYIGLPIRYHGADLRREIADGKLTDVRQWHVDAEDRRMFKIILYLNDVLPGGGPFQYIPRAVTIETARRLRYGSGFVPDDTMSTVLPSARWIECLAKSHSAIMADTCKVFHRAQPPAHFRSLLDHLFLDVDHRGQVVPDDAPVGRGAGVHPRAHRRATARVPAFGASLTRARPVQDENREEAAALLGASVAEAPDVDARSAIFLAIKNAFTLGGALIFTWSIALAIRVILPRHLGPTLFGTLNWAEAFTTTLFVVLGLGMEQYVRKEVAVRPAMAREFYGGSFLVRVAMTLGLLGIIAVILEVSHRSADVRATVFLYALTQFAVTTNLTLGAMLHAKGRVRGMSALSVATKVVWAGGVLFAIAADAGLWAYGASYLASEAIEVVALSWLAKKHVGLAFHVDMAATKRMLVSSLPYYLTAIATTAYGKLDVTLLEFTVGSKEVGLYGAASTLAGLTLLITPIIGWVLMPMLARAAERSRDELYEHVRRSMELVLTVAIPASLLINLGADVWIGVVFGAPYENAGTALRVLSTMFVLTYVAIIYAMTLVMLERAWTVAWISLAGLVVNAGLNLLFVHYSVTLLGEGGGGTGCATAMLGTEIFVSICMAVAIGRGAFDRRSVGTVLRSLAVYAVVVVMHVLLRPFGPGRIAIDGVLYFVLAIAAGALRPKEMLLAVRQALKRPS